MPNWRRSDGGASRSRSRRTDRAYVVCKRCSHWRWADLARDEHACIKCGTQWPGAADPRQPAKPPRAARASAWAAGPPANCRPGFSAEEFWALTDNIMRPFICETITEEDLAQCKACIPGPSPGQSWAASGHRLRELGEQKAKLQKELAALQTKTLATRAKLQELEGPLAAAHAAHEGARHTFNRDVIGDRSTPGVLSIPDSEADVDGSEFDDVGFPGPGSGAMDTGQVGSSGSAPAADGGPPEGPEPTPYPGTTGAAHPHSVCTVHGAAHRAASLPASSGLPPAGQPTRRTPHTARNSPVCACARER